MTFFAQLFLMFWIILGALTACAFAVILKRMICVGFQEWQRSRVRSATQQMSGGLGTAAYHLREQETGPRAAIPRLTTAHPPTTNQITKHRR